MTTPALPVAGGAVGLLREPRGAGRVLEEQLGERVRDTSDASTAAVFDAAVPDPAVDVLAGPPETVRIDSRAGHERGCRATRLGTVTSASG